MVYWLMVKIEKAFLFRDLNKSAIKYYFSIKVLKADSPEVQHLMRESVVWKIVVLNKKLKCSYLCAPQPVWPDKNRQMSIKVAQKWIH